MTLPPPWPPQRTPHKYACGRAKGKTVHAGKPLILNPVHFHLSQEEPFEFSSFLFDLESHTEGALLPEKCLQRWGSSSMAAISAKFQDTQ